MRLLNTSTLELEEFFGNDVLAYAILSHTWTDDEPNYQDWLRQDPGLPQRKGYRKISMSCRQAREDNLEYIWVDTICINKDSSAELSEAINSMFAWYADAQVCYAYLEDVVDPKSEEQLRKSRWFTRGWTLQELLAPSTVFFFSGDWAPVGVITAESFLEITRFSVLLEQITGIDKIFILGGPRSFLGHRAASTALKMSWVSKRTTTRVEDIAYCMLGIFDINMPLLYGEGTKAFRRLQQEIVRTSNDTTIFCWGMDEGDIHQQGSRPTLSAGGASSRSVVDMLCPSPAGFEGGSVLVYYTPPPTVYPQPLITYEMTNAGLRLRLPVFLTEFGMLAILVTSTHVLAMGRYTWDSCAIALSYDSGLGGYTRLRGPRGPVIFSRPPVFSQNKEFHVIARPTIPPSVGPSIMERRSRGEGVLIALNDTRPQAEGWAQQLTTLKIDVFNLTKAEDTPLIFTNCRQGGVVGLGGICRVMWQQGDKRNVICFYLRLVVQGDQLPAWRCRTLSIKEQRRFQLSNIIGAGAALTKFLGQLRESLASHPLAVVSRSDARGGVIDGESEKVVGSTVEINLQRDETPCSPGSDWMARLCLISVCEEGKLRSQ